MGREVQRFFGSKHLQVGMLMPILEGTDGSQKMSKSLGNSIGIDEHLLTMYSKLEKIPDKVVDKYIMLLTDCDISEFSSDPRERQREMALEVVSCFHGKDKAIKAQRDSEAVSLRSPSGDSEVPALSIQGKTFPAKLSSLLKELGVTESTSDSRRRIRSGCVKLDGVKITDENLTIQSSDSITGKVLQVSKKEFYRFS